MGVKKSQPVREWFFKLPLATKLTTPCERVLKTMPEIVLFSCVPFCLRSLGCFARCEGIMQEFFYFKIRTIVGVPALPLHGFLWSNLLPPYFDAWYLPD